MIFSVYPSVFLLFVFGMLHPLHFYMNFRISWLILTRVHLLGLWDGTEFIHQLGKCLRTILSLPIHKYKIDLIYEISSNILQFSVQRLFTPFFRLISNHSIFLMLLSMVFLVQLSNCFVIYRNTVDFCILTFYLASLLNSLNSNSLSSGVFFFLVF